MSDVWPETHEDQVSNSLNRYLVRSLKLKPEIIQYNAFNGLVTINQSNIDWLIILNVRWNFKRVKFRDVDFTLDFFGFPQD